MDEKPDIQMLVTVAPDFSPVAGIHSTILAALNFQDNLDRWERAFGTRHWRRFVGLSLFGRSSASNAWVSAKHSKIGRQTVREWNGQASIRVRGSVVLGGLKFL